MNYSNLFRNLFFITLVIFAASWTALEIKDAFPDEEKKGPFFTCNDKIYTEVGRSTSRLKSYLTSTDGLNWTSESSISCNLSSADKTYQKSAFEEPISAGQGWQNIVNTSTEKTDIRVAFQTMRKTYHAVRRNAVGANTAPNVAIALIEGTGDSRKINYITPVSNNYQVKNVYLHPQNPRKIVTVAQTANNIQVIMGILATDGKSFSLEQKMTLSDQPYTKVAFFNNKLYVMGNDKLFSFDLANPTDNTKFLAITGNVSSNQATTLVSSGYDVKGKFLVTTGSNPQLFIFRNYQTSGTKQLDMIDKGRLIENVLERATVKSSTRTSIGGKGR